MANSKDSNGGSAALDAVIGIAVKNGRTNTGMTLSELSQKSGVSTAMISKIERGQVSGSIGTLNALAEAMGVPIINFFAETIEHREVCYVRAGEGIAVERSGSTYGHAYTMLGKVSSGRIEFETFLITLEKTAAGEPLFHHNGVEFIRMEKGSMTYRYGDRTFLLRPGDSLTFETEAPHGPVSLETDSVEFLTVVAKPKN